MPTPSPIPLDRGLESGLEEIAGASSMFVNALVVGKKGQPRSVRARPGIRAWADGPTSFPSTSPVVAMAHLGFGKLVYVTDNGQGTRDTFYVSGGVAQQMSSVDGERVAGLDHVTLATGRDMAIACGGAAPQLLGIGVSQRLGGSPPEARDAAFSRQRLAIVAPDASGLFYWSDVGTTTSWDQIEDFAEAEARPDKLIGIEETADELYLFGAETVQLFQPDEQFVWSPGPVLEVGCLSKRSIIRYVKTMGWADDSKRLVVSNGRDFEAISDNGLADTLRKIRVWKDCWGFRHREGAHQLLAWVFPTEGRTFAYDLISETWSEWLRWKDGRWQGFTPTSHLWVQDPEDETLGMSLVGMPDGTIRELTLDAHTDMEDTLKWEIRTGFQGGGGRRHAIEAQFPFRRGEGSGAGSVDVSWRDDLGGFCPPISLSLGQPGDYTIHGIISPAGEPYRLREYRLQGAAAEAYALGPGMEYYEQADF